MHHSQSSPDMATPQRVDVDRGLQHAHHSQACRLVGSHCDHDPGLTFFHRLTTHNHGITDSIGHPTSTSTMADSTPKEAPAPSVEGESSSAPAQATQQLDASTIEETKAELVKAQGESLQQHHQARDVIGTIRSISSNVPQQFAPMVNAAAAPTLNAQEAQMKAAEDDLVQLMLRTREMAGRGELTRAYACMNK